MAKNPVLISFFSTLILLPVLVFLSILFYPKDSGVNAASCNIRVDTPYLDTDLGRADYKCDNDIDVGSTVKKGEAVCFEAHNVSGSGDYYFCKWRPAFPGVASETAFSGSDWEGRCTVGATPGCLPEDGLYSLAVVDRASYATCIDAIREEGFLCRRDIISGTIVGNVPYCKAEGGKAGVYTGAFGCIPIDLGSLVNFLLSIAFGIAGGVAILLIILGGYQVMVSAGNPESLQEGKQKITQAVIGLLFIFFSVLILRVIGVGILGIEALKKLFG